MTAKAYSVLVNGTTARQMWFTGDNDARKWAETMLEFEDIYSVLICRDGYIVFNVLP